MMPGMMMLRSSLLTTCLGTILAQILFRHVAWYTLPIPRPFHVLNRAIQREVAPIALPIPPQVAPVRKFDSKVPRVLSRHGEVST